MQQTIAVINQKGGVGKTACAYNLAYQFSMNKLTTCLIDLDPSANSSKGFNMQPVIGLSSAELLLNNQPITCFSIQVNSDNPYLFCIPSSIHLALTQRELNSKPFRESLLSRKLTPHHSSKNIFIIDCSPTLSDLTINSIYAADFILIPVTYEDDALEGLNDLFGVIKEIKEGHTYQYKILRNQFDARKKKTNAYIDLCLQPFIEKQLVFHTTIRQDESINQAKIERKTIFQYAPHSNGAEDFRKLTEEILNHELGR